MVKIITISIHNHILEIIDKNKKKLGISRGELISKAIIECGVFEK